MSFLLNYLKKDKKKNHKNAIDEVSSGWTVENTDSDKLGSGNETSTHVATTDPNCKWQDTTYFQNRWQEYIFVGTCMMSQLLNQACIPQTLSLMNILTKSFHSNAKNQTWLMASFPLVSGSFILISGRVGDIYGLKWSLVGGNIFFIIWALISGFTNYTHSDTFFIVSRSFQGLGVAFILPNVMGCVGNIYKPNTFRKNIVISLIGACAPVGAFMGAFFAGLIGTKNPDDWPWSFYAMAIASTLTLLGALYSIPNHIPTNVHGFSMDWIGSGLAVVGLILLNFVWNQGPIDGWGKAYIIVLLIVSVFVLTLFFIYEVHYAASPLLPRVITQNRHMVMILMALFLGWGSFGIFSFYYFAFLLNLRHYSTVWAGGTYFMFAIWGVVASVVVGLSIRKISASIILFFSMIAFDVGIIMLSVTPVKQTYFRMNLGTMIILSFGMDMSFPAAAIILSDSLPNQYQGMAGSLANTMVNYSMSLCLGMGSTVESQINQNGKDLLKGYRAAEYLGIGIASLAVILSLIYMCERLWIDRKERMESTSETNLS
ncbi:borate transporter KNAG_0G03430 [Huiozyma naganishii CBS 8797]|uniref:Major facilitator superfamily (MFS) profile domain-containing protein n=1 Tax=Huiozyma naganishii (strain ATCC MYA-139 / BCRC 22969 / CBS 8797 / KCTC 17520 / NBRC 10181 / NCYC 3082 / Yp74L-3) TaxID=1071383 RepID=J7S999_HUIN7|nr:hypothetical protein KNAG_0G03430 [Kazachstania naganishii CBS 8797]CCK71401.1 hypothetical protein KNAG_0G03430 [Kazachstania naganishii CBS 8797]